jgi:hypothetical protein
MHASSSSSIFRHKASAHAMRHDRASATLRERHDGASANPRPRNDGVSATLRAVVLGLLMFGALICGLWTGMTLASVLTPPDKGVMDTPY